MDGVLADFYEGMDRAFDVSANDLNAFLSDDGWGMIAKTMPHLFATLPVLPDAKGLMSGLVRQRDAGLMKLYILTAIPDPWHADPEMRRQGTQDKIRWMGKFFPAIPPKNVFVVRRQDKQRYASKQKQLGKPPAVLIDDYQKNIVEWERAGGLGIHHKTSTSSLRQLSNYLN